MRGIEMTEDYKLKTKTISPMTNRRMCKLQFLFLYVLHTYFANRKYGTFANKPVYNAKQSRDWI